jgi:hypothetical protein
MVRERIVDESGHRIDNLYVDVTWLTVLLAVGLPGPGDEEMI